MRSGIQKIYWIFWRGYQTDMYYDMRDCLCQVYEVDGIGDVIGQEKDYSRSRLYEG